MKYQLHVLSYDKISSIKKKKFNEFSTKKYFLPIFMLERKYCQNLNFIITIFTLIKKKLCLWIFNIFQSTIRTTYEESLNVIKIVILPDIER